MLASPIIEGTLPAFYLENGTAEIAVPFSRSRAVSDYDINGYSLKIKNLQGSEYLLTLPHSRYDSNKSIVYFNVIKETAEKVFSIGSFYKVQMAYIDKNGVTGHYSTVGVIKYTTKPEVSILNLQMTKNNDHQYSYTGIYSQEGKDYTEKAYSYRFIIKDQNQAIIKDTGFIVHNHSIDVNQYSSQDVFLFSKDLPPNEKYTITYTVRTNNNLEITSPSYKITTQTTVVSTLISDIEAELNYDNAYVKIKLIGENDPITGVEKMVKGSFVLSRTSEKSNYLDWEVIDRFNLTSSKPSSKIWKDFAIEQGVNYKYCIQQYNKQNLFSQRIISNPIYADFEDIFLYDGERQLKIRFNPKISSFKKNLLESKVDTIGSQFPFIFKNGNVEYREFPIAGLISRIMDEQNLFYIENDFVDENIQRERPDKFVKIIENFPSNSLNDLQKKFYESHYYAYYIEIFDDATNSLKKIKWSEYLSLNTPVPKDRFGSWTYCEEYFLNELQNIYMLDYSILNEKLEEKNFMLKTDLSSTNVKLERDFKMEVLNWLANGKPKLFKSPNEGNYLVRLMNVSLSPQDQLGRMLHDFSCTAYEIDELNYDSMIKYGIINISNENSKYLKIITIPLQTYDANWANLSGINFLPNPSLVPIGPYYAEGDLLKLNRIVKWATIEDVSPGTKFIINGEEITVGANGKYHIPMSVSQITLVPGQKSTGLLTYAYYGEINDSFSQVINTNIVEVIGKQMVGEYFNLMDKISDEITQVSSFYNIRFNKRPICECYIQDHIDYLQIGINGDFYKNYSSIYQDYVTKDPSDPEADFKPAPSEFNGDLQYFKKIIKKDIFTESGKNIARLSENDYIEMIDKEALSLFNPLYLYHFKKKNCAALNTPIYKKITFIETEKQDGFKDGKLIQNRDIYSRTSTNPYLMNLQDYYLYRNNGMLYQKVELIDPKNNNAEISYVQLEPTEEFILPSFDLYIEIEGDFYLDLQSPEDLYIGNNTYQILTREMDIDDVYPKYKHLTYTVSINSNETIIDMSVKDMFNTGSLDKVSIISTPASIYTELFYQAIEVDYDISDNYDLQIAKSTLDDYKEKLTKEYMLKMCIDLNKRDQFLSEKKYIYENYQRLYDAYLISLKAYLKAKEES